MSILCPLLGHKVTTDVSHVQLDGRVSPFMDYVEVSTACSRCGEPIVLGHLKRPAEWSAPPEPSSGHELTLEHFDSDGTTGTIKVCGGTPSPVDGVVGDKVIFKPWYPDDSGEWVEIHHYRELMRLPVATTVEVLSRLERQRKHYTRDLFVAGDLDLYVSLSSIVAYKIVK